MPKNIYLPKEIGELCTGFTSAIRFLWKLFDHRRYEHKLFFIKSKLIPSPEARLIRYRIEYIVVDIGNFLLYSNIKKPLGKSTKWNDKLSSCGSHHHLRTTLLSMPEAIRLKQQEGASDILESLSCYSIYYIVVCQICEKYVPMRVSWDAKKGLNSTFKLICIVYLPTLDRSLVPDIKCWP